MATKLKSSVTFAIELLIFLVIFVMLEETFSIKRKMTFPMESKNFMTLTSVSCLLMEPSYAKVNSCYVKAVNRTHKYFVGNGDLLKTWRKPIMVHLNVLKRAIGGYKPFGIEATLEGCRYMEGKRNPIVDWFYDINFKHSNINHTCPYSGNIFGNVPVSQTQYPSVFPEGDYLFNCSIGTEGKWVGLLKAYLTLKEL